MILIVIPWWAFAALVALPYVVLAVRLLAARRSAHNVPERHGLKELS